MQLTWDDPESGTGLHVYAVVKDQQGKLYKVEETQLKHIPFYQKLFGNADVVKSMGDGSALTPEEAAEYVNTWADRFTKGIPLGKMTIEQGEEAVGCVQLAQNIQRPGVGELARAFTSSVQGKGLGKSSLEFVVNEWAPALYHIGRGQDNKAPPAAVDKFKCFGGEELKVIYTAARPSNVASWKCYKYFNFYPSQATDETHKISCEGWEMSQHGPLEEYIINKHFSPSSSDQLQVDVLYEMFDENGDQRTLSFVKDYGSLRYHYERPVVMEVK